MYILYYGKPRNVREISELLYDGTNSKVSVWNTELVNEGYIKEYKIKKTDRRYNYYYATVDWIYESIIKTLKNRNINDLNKDQIKNLKSYLDGSDFRTLMNTYFTKDIRYIDDIFYYIKDMLGYQLIINDYEIDHVSKLCKKYEYYFGEKTIEKFNRIITDKSLRSKLKYLKTDSEYVLKTCKDFSELSDLLTDIIDEQFEEIKDLKEKLEKK